MRDFRAVLIAILGVILFITLLPALLWLLVIILIIIAIFSIYSRIKYKRFMKNVQQDFDNDFFRENTGQDKKDHRIDPDVIDVEYSEKDEDES